MNADVERIRLLVHRLTRIEGCTQSEVSDLERKYNVTLPADYREFLLLAGRGAGKLWLGSDYTLDEITGMEEAAIELLSAVGLKLPDGAFVFLMHQGYQFFFLDDGKVFYYMEGKSEIEKRYESFTEFLETSIVNYL